MLRTIDRAARGMLAALGIGLILMVGLSVWNVVARYVFSSALLWADEVAVFAMIAIAWLGAIACAWRDTEIRMDVILHMLPERLRTPLLAFQQLVIAGLCGWVAWLSLGYVQRTFQIGMRSDGAGLPMWIIHATIPLGLACIAAIATLRFFRIGTGRSASLSPGPQASDVPHE